MPNLMIFLAIGGGGALGAVLRHAVQLIVTRFAGTAFPYGTLGINIVGSLAMGLLVGWAARSPMSLEMRSFLAIGVLGGFTTFSAFSLDVVTLVERGEMAPAMLYLVASVTLSIIGVAVGMMLMRPFAA